MPELGTVFRLPELGDRMGHGDRGIVGRPGCGPAGQGQSYGQGDGGAHAAPMQASMRPRMRGTGPVRIQAYAICRKQGSCNLFEAYPAVTPAPGAIGRASDEARMGQYA